MSAFCVVAVLQRAVAGTKYLVCAVYIPPASSQHCLEGFQGYSVVLEAMQEGLLGLQLEHNVAVNRTAIMGDFYAHVGLAYHVSYLVARICLCMAGRVVEWTNEEATAVALDAVIIM